MIIDTTTYDYTLIKADEGKLLKRKGANDILTTELALGYSYYIDGVLLPEPHKDVPEDFEEIDIPEGYYAEEDYVEPIEEENNEVQS